MAACFESLSFVNISHMLRMTALLMLEAGMSDKDGAFWVKANLFHLLCTYAMKTAYCAELFVVADNPCVQLAGCRMASAALILPRSWKFKPNLLEMLQSKFQLVSRNRGMTKHDRYGEC